MPLPHTLNTTSETSYKRAAMMLRPPETVNHAIIPRAVQFALRRVVGQLNFGTYCVTNHKIQTDPLLAPAFATKCVITPANKAIMPK